jgi:hypothetical protein
MDLVWVKTYIYVYILLLFSHELQHEKLHDRADGLFHVLRRINENAYKIDLLGDAGISTTFEVIDLQASKNNIRNYICISKLSHNIHVKVLTNLWIFLFFFFEQKLDPRVG